MDEGPATAQKFVRDFRILEQYFWISGRFPKLPGFLSISLDFLDSLVDSLVIPGFLLEE